MRPKLLMPTKANKSAMSLIKINRTCASQWVVACLLVAMPPVPFSGESPKRTRMQRRRSRRRRVLLLELPSTRHPKWCPKVNLDFILIFGHLESLYLSLHSERRCLEARTCLKFSWKFRTGISNTPKQMMQLSLIWLTNWPKWIHSTE